MKTKLIFLVSLLASFCCCTNPGRPLSDTEKDKIKGEVKEVVNTVFKGSEEANADMIIGTYLDSPDFVFTWNGNSFGYKPCIDLLKFVFGTLKNQKFTVVDEKYVVLDNSTVMVTVINKCLMNYKDGHSVLLDPWISQFIIKKTDYKWKVISLSESGIEKNVPGESSKGLNQVEFMQQFLGTWKAEYGKDTIVIYNARPFGNGSERDITMSSKGVIINSVKQLLGYDKEMDKLIEVTLYKSSPNLIINVWWATSKTTAEGVPLKDISNPENATIKLKCEFKSPDVFILTNIINNKVVGAYTYTREKK